MSDDYVMTRSNNRLAETLDDEAVDYIQLRLKERSAFKKDKMYDAADEIRDELRSKYGVSIDDRTREWCMEVDQFTVVDNTGRSRGGAPQRQGYEVAAEDSDDDFFENLKFDDAEGDDDGNDGGATQVEGNLENLTVPQLKEKLKAAGLPVSGRKAELIERLTSSEPS